MDILPNIRLTIYAILLFCSISIQSAVPKSVHFSLAPILKKTMPAVVNITTTGTKVVNSNPWFSDPFFQRFFRSQQQKKQISNVGSGVIINAKKGLIITNQHVIKDFQEITVTLIDGTSYSAKVVGQDEATDLAIVQIDAKNLTEIQYSDSHTLQIGDFVIAIGNPFGLDHTVTSGIISALERSARVTGLGGPYKSYIQTDASINPGNSGGALITLDGKLAGINSAILSKSGGNVGIGFAVPSNLVSKVSQQLIRFGRVRRGILGVSAQTMNSELAKSFSLNKKTKGALITKVQKGLAADKGGIKTGDIIVFVNNLKKRYEVSSAFDLINQYGYLPIGTSALLTVIRNGRKHTVKVVVSDQVNVPTIKGKTLHQKLSGATIGISEMLNVTKDNSIISSSTISILAIKKNSLADQLGLKKKDIIVNVNNEELASLNDLKRYFKKLKLLRILIKRGNSFLSLVVRS